MSQQSADILEEVFTSLRTKSISSPGIPDLPVTIPVLQGMALDRRKRCVAHVSPASRQTRAIENVIQAMPSILSRTAMLLHGFRRDAPHILRREGDKYRLYLQNWRRNSGVQDNVIFRNRFVSPREHSGIDRRSRYLSSAPYRHKGQSFRNALLCLERGKAIISTPLPDAIELLDDHAACLFLSTTHGRCRKNDRAIGNNCTARHAMRKRRTSIRRNMVWDRVAQQYMGSFDACTTSACGIHAPPFRAKTRKKGSRTVFRLKLDSSAADWTDHTGIVEHAVFPCQTIRKDIRRTTNDSRAHRHDSSEELGGSIPAVRSTSPLVIWLFCGWASTR